MTEQTSKTFSATRQRVAVLVFGWVGLLLAAAAFLGQEDLRATFNSDIYYLPVLVKDILHMGGALSEWRLPPAPYFFPDLLLYFTSSSLTDSPVLALALTGVAHYIIFIGGWFALATRFGRDSSSRFTAQTAVLLLGVMGMVLESLTYVRFWSTQVTMHFGVMAVTPWFLLLTDISISGKGLRRRAFAAAGLLLMAWGLAASDMLSAAQVLLPSCIALLLLLIVNRARWQDVLLAWVVIGTGAILGVSMLRWFGKASATGYVQPDLLRSSDATRAFVRWIISFVEFQRTAAFIAILFLAAHAALMLYAVARAARAKSVDSRRLHLSAFVSCAVPINVLAVLIMGNFFSSADARYALSLMFYPLFSAPILLTAIKIPAKAAPRIRAAGALLFAVVLALNSGAMRSLGNLDHYSQHYPQWVKWVDHETAKRGISDGVGSYWDAKELILLSSNGVKMVQSTTYMVPYNWISNTKWFDRVSPRFFLCSTNPKETDRVQESNVIARFGEPDERVTYGSRSLLVYPADSELLSWYRDHPMRQEFTYPGDCATFPAAELPGDIGDVVDSSRVAEPPARAGSLTLGPYSMMPQGSYRATVRYSAAPGPDYVSSGYWQLRTVTRSGPEVLREEPLDPGTDKAIVDFDLSKRSSVELLTSYTGSGRLEVISISFERLR